VISRERSEVFGKQLVERRRRGRPKSLTPKPQIVPTSVRLPEDVFAALCRRAAAERVPLHRLLTTKLTELATNFQ
jgi:hypothetical protein